MKKRYLKGWVKVVLAMVLLISMIILGSESDSYFISSKLIAMVTFLISGYLLIKYTKIEE